MKSPLSIFRTLLLASAFCLSADLHANLTLPALFSDHAVLQRADRVPIWGKADPGENVTVAIAGEVATAKSDQLGRWRVILNLSNKSAGPFELNVVGKDRITVSDVLIGEVWICSGQSNMEWTVDRTIGAANEIASSSNPELRVFEPERKASGHPLDDIRGKWLVAGPAATGGFPAVGYYFGKDVQRALKAPVGLVNISWGGTPVEAWIGRRALDSDPDLRTGTEDVMRIYDGFPVRLHDYVSSLNAWMGKYRRQEPAPADPATFAAPGLSTADWTPVDLPGNLDRAGLADAGAIWLRRKFTITPAMTVGPLFIRLGVLRDFDTLYVNGIKIGETTPQTAGSASPRMYFLNANAVKTGEIVLALRLVAPAGGAAVAGPGEDFSIDETTLSGQWMAKVEYALPRLSPSAKDEYPAPLPKAPVAARAPSSMFNGMVNPLIPYAIRGAVWYQGEDNAGRAFQYRTAFPLMIRDWRRRWGEGDFPFYFCQLPNFGKINSEPADGVWAELRESQTKTLALPNTGQAVLIDLGEDGDIHPRDKTEVGARLARIALAKTYGRDIACSGPVFDTMKVEGDAICVHFIHTEGGLVARKLPGTYRPMTVDAATLPLVRHSPESEVEGFAICGEDRRWKWADAKIDGASVRVWARGVTKPIAVRYAWANSPIFNLYNGDGLPAAPFRTDDFPGVTDKRKYGSASF